MSQQKSNQGRRAWLNRAGSCVVAALGLAVVAGPSGLARAAKKKGKSAKEDFYFQTTPDEATGHKCDGCANFEPYSEGYPKATVALLAPDEAKDGEKGVCALLEGEVCVHCYCQGWTDKKTGKKHAS